MSRCRKWRSELEVFPSNGDGGETTEAEELTTVQQGRAHYKTLVDQYPYPSEEDDNDETETEDGNEGGEVNGNAPAAATLDPLTAMMMEEQSKQERLQEKDLQYRKERARRRNRGVATQRVVESEEYDETAVTLQIIDKDLNRLPHPHSDNSHQEQRIALLRQILFVYHCSTHPMPGYRQGMHEIASFLLLALEQEHGLVGSVDGMNDMDAAGDTYALLFAVLNPLQPAFDVAVASSSGEGSTDAGDKQPLVSLGRRVLQRIGLYHPTLLQWLQQRVQVPPQLYLTKWIRLLFSRELVNPAQSVLPFWDFLFSQCSTNTNLMLVLEAAAAARLLYHAPKILSSEDPLHYLMNVPQEQESSMLEAWKTITAEILTSKDGPLSHVVLTNPQPPAPRPVPEQGPPSSGNANQNAPETSLWNHPLSALTASSAVTADAVANARASSSWTDDQQQQQNAAPQLLSSLSAGLKNTLEQAKSKTQSLSKRITQEWEQLQEQQTHLRAQQVSESLTRMNVSNDHYNVMYRDESRGLYDPPLSNQSDAAQRPRPSSDREQEHLQMQSVVIHSYLTHLEQEKGIAVPPNVWQAIADLRTSIGQ